MSDLETLPSDGGAETVAPFETEVSAPVAEQERSPSKSAREALERAFRDVSDQPRDDAGKWTRAEQEAAAQKKAHSAPKLDQSASQPVNDAPGADKTPQTQSPAPTRFSKEAQEAWGQTPDPVRREVERAMGELTRGITEYQQRWEPLRQFDEMARQGGKELPSVIAEYVNMENALRENPLGGFVVLCQRLGLDVSQVGQALAGQASTGGTSPDVSPLLNEIAELKRQIAGVSQTFEQRQAEADLARWSSDKPRFDEVRQLMGQLIQGGIAQDLDEAYEKATRLQPPAPSFSLSSAPAAPARPQPPTRPTLQITGSPSGASDAASVKPPSSFREALERRLRE